MTRAVRAGIAALVVGSGLGAGIVAAAPAGAVTPTYYVAMGDSLGGGTGASTGANAYVNRLYQHELARIPGLQLQNFSCGGATTGSVLHGPNCGSTSTQLELTEAFLRAHPGQVAFLTIDIGGNDVGGCSTADDACLANGINAVNTNLPQILTWLKFVYPGLKVIGMNYYDPFLAAWLNGADGQATAQKSAPQSDAFNSVLTARYADASVPTADVSRLFDTDSFAMTGTFNGQTLPQNVANICNWTHMCPAGDIHANDTGHALLATAFAARIDSIAAPDAPTSPHASPGDTTATVSWTAPYANGSSIYAAVVTPYIGTVAQPAQMFYTSASSVVVTGLVNGTSYTFKVAAVNETGTGAQSTATAAIKVGTPAAPWGVEATAGNAVASVHWIAGSANAAAITGYVVTPFVGAVAQPSRTFNTTATSRLVAGLTNGTTYSFTVAAKNALGTGEQSTGAQPIVVGAPAPPSHISVLSGSPTGTFGAMNVVFVAGVDHGAPITQYTATCVVLDGSPTRSGTVAGPSATTISVFVTTGKLYFCTVTATNSRGTSVPSSLAGPTTQGAPRAPAKPTVVRTAPGSLRVAFAAPVDGGSPITQYGATCVSTNGGVQNQKLGVASPLTITGLTASKSYYCRVGALNSRGGSPQSPPSAVVVA